MRRILLLLCGIMFIPVLCYPQHLVEVGKGYSCTSVNTTVFRNNSLITHGDEQYISYYDAEGYLVLGKRKLNSELWTLHRIRNFTLCPVEIYCLFTVPVLPDVVIW